MRMLITKMARREFPHSLLVAGLVLALLGLCAVVALGLAGRDRPAAAQGGLTLSLDMDISDGPCTDIDSSATHAVGDHYQVAVCVDGLEPGSLVGGFGFTVRYDDKLNRVLRAIDAGTVFDDNPDVNAGITTWGDGLGFELSCSSPVGDGDPLTGPQHGATGLSCHWSNEFEWCAVADCPLFLGDDESRGVLAVISFAAVAGGTDDMTVAGGISLYNGDCDPEYGECFYWLVDYLGPPIASWGGTAQNVEWTPATPPAGSAPRMVKDMDVLQQGVQTTGHLLAMSPELGCPDAVEGIGCLRIDNWLFGVADSDSPSDPDSVPEGLGSWEEQVTFDSTTVSLTPVPATSWLQSADRIANCSVTVINDNSVLAGCTTADDPAMPGTQLGPNGDGLVQHIYVVPKTNHLISSGQLRPTRGNGITTEIVDENCKLADALGEPIPGTLPGDYTSTCGDAQIRLHILEGDLDLDCDVDVVDDQMVAFRFGSVVGESTYDAWHDIEPDTPNGEIDILDLQSVFGRNWSTCQAPIPEYQAQAEQPPPRPTPPPDATVEMEVVSDGLEAGTEVVVVVRAYNIPSAGVGAIEASWTYDPEVIRDWSIGLDWTDLQSTGRIANCTLSLVFRGALRQGCVTWDDFDNPGMQPAPSGTVELPFHFTRLRSGPTGISLLGTVLGDPLGNELYRIAPPTPTVDVSGAWSLTAQTTSGPNVGFTFNCDMNLSQNGTRVWGDMSCPTLGDDRVWGVLNEARIAFDWGVFPVNIVQPRFTGQVSGDGNSQDGTWSAVFPAQGPVTWSSGTYTAFRAGLPVDADGDGIPDAQDACPDDPEDINPGSLYDDDGCPSWSFAVITDLHIGRYWEDAGEDYYLTKRLKDTLSWISRGADDRHIKFVVVLGDLSESGIWGELDKAKTILEDWERESIDPVTGKARLVYVPLIGNHDVGSGGRDSFSRVFSKQFDQLAEFFQDFVSQDLPQDNFLGFAFTYNDVIGPARFIALDFSGGGSPIASNAYMNELFVRTRLQVSPPAGAPVFVLAHHPLGPTCSGFLWPFSTASGVLDAIAEGTRGSTVITLGGHVHGYPPWSSWDKGTLKLLRSCLREPGAVFDANADETRPWNEVDIRSLTTEALMVGSNQEVGTPPKDKGFVRIIKVEGNQVLPDENYVLPNYNLPPPVAPDDEPAFNPYIKKCSVKRHRLQWLTTISCEGEKYSDRTVSSWLWDLDGNGQADDATGQKTGAISLIGWTGLPRKICLVVKGEGTHEEKICQMW